MTGTKFHISPRTHSTERCRAGSGEKSKGCPYGDVSPHFSTREEADAYIEQQAASENSEIPPVSIESKTLQSSLPLSPLTEEQYRKCSQAVDPIEGRRISDSISILRNPDRGWALERVNSLPHDSREYRSAKIALNYAYHYERVEEAMNKRENIAWRGRHAKTEEQREAYRQQWRVANAELNGAKENFQRSKNERDIALRYYEDLDRSRVRIKSIADEYHSDGSFSYRRFSKEEAQRIAEKSNLYQALNEKISKGDDKSLNDAANIHGSQHLIREVKGYTDYRKLSEKEGKAVERFTERIALTEDPAEKRRLMDLRSKAEARKTKADDMMGQYSRGYTTLVNEVRNGMKESNESLEYILKSSRK